MSSIPATNEPHLGSLARKFGYGALDLAPAEVDAISLTGVRAVHVDDTDFEASIRLAGRARDAGVIVTTDIDAGASLAGRGVVDLMALATHLILSESALAQLSGASDPAAGLRVLRQRHAGVLVVTLGPRGSMALDTGPEAALVAVPAPQVTAVDTTGAGDCFAAAFTHAIAGGQAAAAAARYASAAAAIAVTRAGAQSMPTRDEVAAFLAAH